MKVFSTDFVKTVYLTSRKRSVKKVILTKDKILYSIKIKNSGSPLSMYN
ncbi:TPA: hypothetical protein ACGO5N_001759 [Streptococcus suis]